jgi:two-component system cell cycle sensor histidine kinase PleC
MPSEKPLAKRRRLAAQRVREARERLTSPTGTRVAFDYELLRQFAENRLSASLVILLLVGTVGFLSSLGRRGHGGRLTAAVLVIHAVIITKCRHSLPSRRRPRTSSAGGCASSSSILYGLA